MQGRPLATGEVAPKSENENKMAWEDLNESPCGRQERIAAPDPPHSLSCLGSLSPDGFGDPLFAHVWPMPAHLLGSGSAL